MPIVLPTRSRVLGFCLLSALLSLLGCGQSGPKLNPVKVKVTVGGQPAVGAIVTFHPKANQPPPAIRPSGTIGEDGTCDLTSKTAKDGAPAGEYAVTIIWFGSDDKKAQPKGTFIGNMAGGGGEDKSVQRDRLGNKYREENTTPLKATVKDGANDPIVFDLPG